MLLIPDHLIACDPHWVKLVIESITRHTHLALIYIDHLSTKRKASTDHLFEDLARRIKRRSTYSSGSSRSDME